EFPDHPRISVRRLSYCPPGWKLKLHYLYFCLWCLWYVAWNQPSYAYVSDPPACPIGLILSFFPGVQVIYHEHDSPASMTRTGIDKLSASGLLSGIGPRLRWLARRAIARSAKACVLPQADRAALFA